MEEFERTRAWMLGWGLVSQNATFEELVDNRVGTSSIQPQTNLWKGP